MLSLLSQRLAFRASALGLNTALRSGVVANNNAALLTSRAWSRSFVSTPLLAYPTKATTATTKKATTTTKKADAKPVKKAAGTTAKKAATAKKPVRRVAAKKKAPAKKKLAVKKKPKKVVVPKPVRVKKEDLPPKKPVTPYLRFFLKFRQTHLAPGAETLAGTQAIASDSGKAWKELSESEQASYKEEYQLELADYYKRRKEYFEKVPDETLKAINMSRKKKGLKRLSSRGTYTGSRRPVSAFLLFLQDFRKTFTPTTTSNQVIIETSRAGGAAWKALPEAEKARYIKIWEDSKAAAAATAAHSTQ